MSTFYATFTNWKEARSTTDELVNGGVRSDDLSLLLCSPRSENASTLHSEITEQIPSVGDATSWVGGTDDPVVDEYATDEPDTSRFTSVEASRLSPVDTSNIDSDVESVDQMSDSQNETEFMISPFDGISPSIHENDDVALTALTGFPTSTSNFSEEPPNPFELGDQSAESLEIIEIPKFGMVIGSGALATAALDFSNGRLHSLVGYLTDEGVPQEMAQIYQESFEAGQAILAVEVTPGKIDEGIIESIAERHGALNGELYDAPRY